MIDLAPSFGARLDTELCHLSYIDDLILKKRNKKKKVKSLAKKTSTENLIQQL
jgi:hypothetical protein